MATRIKPPAPLEQPLTFTRADPAELARFDPSTKICMMNCGPHRDDPRTSAERKLLCPECWPNVGGEARLAAHQPSQTTTATPQGVASTDQLGRASEARN